MKALLQRVKRARVEVDGTVTGEIGAGLLVLLGVAPEDDEETAVYLADRCAGLRIFEDEAGRMNRSVLDINGGVLAVSQFTLLADTTKGRRPYFGNGAPPEQAEKLYEKFKAALEELGVPTASGIFAADMQVTLTNDGPVTIMLDAGRNGSGRLGLR